MFNNKFRIGVLQHPGYHKGKGGGGSPQPTQSTSYTTNIPEYAKPYVENMLNATQAQIYNSDMGGFNKYVPYSTDPTKYVAGFSPLQSYAQSGAANLNLPANYGLATGQTLGTGMQMGALAPQMGMAGANYGAMATNPYATSAYMNPYLSASLAPQLAEARRQYDITGAQQQSAATRAGGFGGSREALMAAENRRNMGTAMNQMIGQGYNQAFGQAQQAQQFGANLGLQGQQAQLGALQGQLGAANQLAGLGGQQLQAQQGIYNLQNQFGQQQQAQQQNIINQAIQNYATEQQYPFMQLGVLNSMLRGLPMQQSSTQMYQAPPNPINQALSLGALGAGAIGAVGGFGGGQKSGGLTSIKKMAAGGSAIPMKSYSDPQLQNVIKSPASSMMADIYAQSLLKDRAYLKANPMASGLINQQQMPQGMPPGMPQTPPMPSPDQMAMAPQTRVGLDTIGTGEMTQMAGGGLLAFADGDVVPSSDIPRGKRGQPDWTEMYARNIAEGKTMGVEKAAADEVKAIRDQIAKRDREKVYYGLMAGGAKGLQNTSQYLGPGLGSIGQGFIESVGKQDLANETDLRKLLEQGVEGAKADQARNIQERNAIAGILASEYNKEIGLRQVDANTALQNSIRDEQLTEKANNNFLNKVNEEEKRILASSKYEGYTPEYIRALAYNNTVRETSKKVLDRLGHTPIPADRMPLSKPAEAPKEPDLIDRILGRNKTPAPVAAPAGPKIGETKVIGNVTYQYDGKGWLPR
jgi:hypothetical protein